MTDSVIVEFVGLPGVGKSTLTQAVASELEAHGVKVHKPVYKRDTYTTPRRILSKAQFVIRYFFATPGTALKMSYDILQTDQQSPSDLTRIIFNHQYVAGVTATYRPRNGITLLDQGIFQAYWSIGLRSTQPVGKTITTLDIPPHLNPDVVVFVEASDKIIANRLINRTDGDTRFEPNSDAFERAREGYKTIQSLIEEAPNGPKSINIENETQDSLRPNAIRVADMIQSVTR